MDFLRSRLQTTLPRTELSSESPQLFYVRNCRVQKALVLTRVYNAAMRFDKRIRFAAVVDSRGGILEGGMRAEVEPIEPLEKTPELISQLIACESAESRAVFFGAPEYSVLVHEKIVAVIYYLKDGFILVTAHRLFPLSKAASLGKHLVSRRLKRA